MAEGGTLAPTVTAALGLLSVAALPFLLAVGTAFAKIVVVLGLLRHGLGTPRVPAGIVLVAVAGVLTAVAMGPTLAASAAAAGDLDVAAQSPAALVAAAGQAAGPLERFLSAHTAEEDLALFRATATRLHGAPPSEGAGRTFLLLAAFSLSELKQAFWMGLLLVLPFLVVDLVVAQSLLAAGLSTVPPERVALVFKLLLFVSIDGWALLMRALLLSY